MPREILTEWSTPSGSDHRTVMFFDPVGNVASQRAALKAFYDTIKSQLDNGVNWTIQTSGRELDDATGALTGVWSESTPAAGVGVVNGEPVADATQVVMQWRTSNIVNGRFLQGRSYIPGLSSTHLSDGNVSSTVISAWTAAGQTLMAVASGLQIWHRPVAGSGGVAHDVDQASVWSELGVLRRRRN